MMKRHPDPVIHYHMQQRHYHNTIAKHADQAANDIKEQISLRGARPSYTKGLRQAEGLRNRHRKLAEWHNNLAQEYGRGVGHKHGRWDVLSKTHVAKY